MQKNKMPLSYLQQNPLFQRIDQPDIVYHLTPRKNLESIMSDGRIRTFQDFVCFFFPAVEEIPVYFRITGALHGRQFYGWDGRIKTAPPLVPEEHIVLKLIPRYSEPLLWFKEDTTDRLKMQASRENWTEEKLQKLLQQQTAFDNSRILHYGDMKFKTNKVDVLELSDILNNY